MPPVSYNGWPASPSLNTVPLVVHGETFPGGVRPDPVYTCLKYVAEQFHARVEPIVRADWHQADDWGFYYRLSTGSAYYLSCHASGTAIDINATRHPYGIPAYRTFTAEQIREIHQILAEARVVEWGGDWNLADGMHFEISGSYAEVAAAAARIRDNQGEPPMADSDVILARLNKLDEKVDRIAAQGSRVIKKLNASREREANAAQMLRDLDQELDDKLGTDSPVRKQLRALKRELEEHAAEEPDEGQPELPA